MTGEYEVTFHLRYGASIPLIASAGYAAYIMSPNAADKDTEWFNAGNDGGSGPYTIATVSARAVTLSSYEAIAAAGRIISIRTSISRRFPTQVHGADFLRPARPILLLNYQQRILEH